MLTSNALVQILNALKGVKGHSENNVLDPESRGIDVLTRDRNELDASKVPGQQYNFNLGLVPQTISGQMPSYAPRGF